MSKRRSGRIHYFKVILQLEGGAMSYLRILARDPVEAMKVAEDLHNTAKNAVRVIASSAVQQLDPLFEPLTTVN